LPLPFTLSVGDEWFDRSEGIEDDDDDLDMSDGI